MGTRKIVSGTGLAAVLAAVAVAPANAAVTPVTCVFDGLVGNINPGVMLIGGTGAYEFQSRPGTTACGVGGAPVIPSRIVSTGTFVNVICGTGSAADEDASVTIGGTPNTMGYTINF